MKYCPADCSVCGDGLCTGSETYATCIQDCPFPASIPTECQFPIPQSNVQAGLPVRDDTIGQLIANQFLWQLPGTDHFAHGYNIFTGSEETAPIFQFTYCTGALLHTLQDAYRGNIYQIPYQV